jgi:hypothetical protein
MVFFIILNGAQKCKNRQRVAILGFVLEARKGVEPIWTALQAAA